MKYKLTSKAKQLGLYEDGLIPSTMGSAGIDLCACIDKPISIYPDRTHTMIHTGLHVWVNNDKVAMALLPRSSSGIALANTIGIVDSDYQREIMLKVVNHGNDVVTIHPGERIAQMLFLQIIAPLQINFEQVAEFDESTGRGGFGSTGK